MTAIIIRTPMMFTTTYAQTHAAADTIAAVTVLTSTWDILTPNTVLILPLGEAGRTTAAGKTITEDGTNTAGTGMQAAGGIGTAARTDAAGSTTVNPAASTGTGGMVRITDQQTAVIVAGRSGA